MNHIANYRFVVIGQCGDRRGPIYATDLYKEAKRILEFGAVIDDRVWSGVRIHDRRASLMPVGGWYS